MIYRSFICQKSIYLTKKYTFNIFMGEEIKKRGSQKKRIIEYTSSSATDSEVETVVVRKRKRSAEKGGCCGNFIFGILSFINPFPVGLFLAFLFWESDRHRGKICLYCSLISGFGWIFLYFIAAAAGVGIAAFAGLNNLLD